VPLEVVTDYMNFVSTPMDLSTVYDKCMQNRYEAKDQFLADIGLIAQNCRAYNVGDSTRGAGAYQTPHLVSVANNLMVECQKMLYAYSAQLAEHEAGVQAARARAGLPPVAPAAVPSVGGASVKLKIGGVSRPPAPAAPGATAAPGGTGIKLKFSAGPPKPKPEEAPAPPPAAAGAAPPPKMKFTFKKPPLPPQQPPAPTPKPPPPPEQQRSGGFFDESDEEDFGMEVEDDDDPEYRGR